MSGAAATQADGPLSTSVRWILGPTIPMWFIAVLRIFETVFGTVDVLQTAANSLLWLFRVIPFVAVLAPFASHINSFLRFIVVVFETVYAYAFYVPLDWLFGLVHLRVADVAKDAIVCIASILVMTWYFARRKRHLELVAAAAQTKANALANDEIEGFAATSGAGAVIGLVLGGPIGALIGFVLGSVAAEALIGDEAETAHAEAQTARLNLAQLRYGALYSIGYTILLMGVFLVVRVFQ